MPVRRRQCVENHSTTPRTRRQNCRPKNRPPSGQICGHRASNAHRADNERSGCTWVWFHPETNMPKCRRADSGVLIKEPPEKHVSEGNLRRGAKLRGPKTYYRDRNHATRKAKALVPPQDEVTRLLRQKTRQKPYAMAMRAHAGLV